MKPEEIRLYFTQGSSDKVYQVQLHGLNNDWVVNFQYGRRGKPMTTGTKTRTPVPYDVAKKAYDKLVQTKFAKGYTPDSSGVTYSNTPASGTKTTFLPQLLNQVTESEAEEVYWENKGKTMLQIKHDGERRGVIIDHGTVIGANRRGLEVALPDHIVQACLDILTTSQYYIELDTEDMGDHLVIFDVLKVNDTDLRNRPFINRAGLLYPLKHSIQLNNVTALHVDLPFTPDNLMEFRDYIENARGANEEGVVIRDSSAIYIPGRPNSGGGIYKLKFIETATVKVAAIHPTKRSFSMTIKDGNTWHNVGNCTVPANKKIPPLGELVDVRYLYAYQDGAIYQPVYDRIRPDLTDADAHRGQLKYKRT